MSKMSDKRQTFAKGKTAFLWDHKAVTAGNPSGLLHAKGTRILLLDGLFLKLHVSHRIHRERFA
jgi:hypothetical protein